MIKNILKIERDHSKDYEFVIREKSVKTIKLFGISIFTRDWDVINSNNDSISVETKNKTVGFKLSKNEKSAGTKE
jgi:hypothetical protein